MNDEEKKSLVYFSLVSIVVIKQIRLQTNQVSTGVKWHSLHITFIILDTWPVGVWEDNEDET